MQYIVIGAARREPKQEIRKVVYCNSTTTNNNTTGFNDSVGQGEVGASTKLEVSSVIRIIVLGSPDFGKLLKKR